MATAAKFILSAPGWRQLPPAGLPEIAFCGRSNVGKSSLLGAVLGAPSLVRTSRTPGRTQLLNYFRANFPGGTLGLCDLPGYGWAKLSRGQRLTMQRMIEDYLRHREQLLAVVLLVDGRRDTVSPLDVEMAQILANMGRPVEVVATKCDALAKNVRLGVLRRIGLGLGLPSPRACSARTGEGVRELADLLHAWARRAA